ncbi:Zinc finger SWIM domain-containing protein 8 [Amphibalanus amphitrite]|uniref:Zinc finger SWIM domain-containing protein 8 n=1 Tax=Amphibalanus amphitrite TaxID=1232801 RepID=A0A6A4VQ27_AMPAM|nr:Zinc finger SWIM domain-containing protein 8 [Amphibalanus amphitrite]
MNERVLNSIRPVTDHWEVLFARAEGLHAHGFTPDACRIGVTLAQQLLSNPPDLTVEPAVAQAKTKKRRGVNPVTHQVTCLASTTLSRCHFLCTVLAEEQEHHHLAFQVGLYGLEMCRPPASTKPLEVKLANQEAELLQLLRRIPLWPSELAVLRQRAECLRSGELKTRGEALVPLTLATLIVDALVAPSLSSARNGGTSGSSTSAAGSSTNHRLPGDEELGFEAAVTALGLKANVSEADHPLLCEGTRRQRGELATLLLVHYKDDQERLAKIMDKLLDKEVHRMFKAPTLSSYYSTRPPPSDPRPRRADDAPAPGGGGDRDGDRPPASGSPPGWEEGYKLWEAKFRCTNLKTHRKHHSQGMASIDSSAPETTSSDNSPTLLLLDYLTPERLCGDNQYYCTKCTGLRDAERQLRLLSPPANLVVSLMRFAVDRRTGARRKVLTPVELTEWLTVPLATGPPAQYRLYAVIVHAGHSLDAGHYFSFCRASGGGGIDGMDDTGWWLLDDTSAVPVPAATALGRPRRSTEAAYTLLYRLTDAAVAGAAGGLSALAALPGPLRAAVERDNAVYRRERQSRTAGALPMVHDGRPPLGVGCGGDSGPGVPRMRSEGVGQAERSRQRLRIVRQVFG